MQTEVIFLGQLRHPHLVKLIGYCYEDEHRLLVYEFMTRGSLEKHLFKSKHTLQIKLQLLTFQTFFTAHLSISYSDTSVHTPRHFPIYACCESEIKHTYTHCE